jgi:hypothetical protein
MKQLPIGALALLLAGATHALDMKNCQKDEAGRDYYICAYPAQTILQTYADFRNAWSKENPNDPGANKLRAKLAFGKNHKDEYKGIAIKYTWEKWYSMHTLDTLTVETYRDGLTIRFTFISKDEGTKVHIESRHFPKNCRETDYGQEEESYLSGFSCFHAGQTILEAYKTIRQYLQQEDGNRYKHLRTDLSVGKNQEDRFDDAVIAYAWDEKKNLKVDLACEASDTSMEFTQQQKGVRMKFSHYIQ